MKRRKLLGLLSFSVAAGLAAEPAATTVRGKLTQREGQPPQLEIAGRTPVALSGDSGTLAVLRDKRLAGSDIEAVGTFSGPDAFAVNPIHTKGLYLHKQGKRHTISYWCATCAIRTYEPDLCVCCREDTELDPQPAE